MGQGPLAEPLQHGQEEASRPLSALPTSKDPTVLAALDDWENTWFPIADATLTRHFPAVRDLLFLNLTQTEGIEVIISTSTFIERLAAMAKGTEGYGEDGKAARALLEARGLDATAIGQAEALLAKLGPMEPPQPDPQLPKPRTAEEFAKLSVADISKAIGAPPTMVLVAPPSNAGFAVVGDGTITKPGRYLVLCAIPTGADPAAYMAAAAKSKGGPVEVPGGPPHYMEGMITEFTAQ